MPAPALQLPDLGILAQKDCCKLDEMASLLHWNTTLQTGAELDPEND
jgi:hypothetical protein